MEDNEYRIVDEEYTIVDEEPGTTQVPRAYSILISNSVNNTAKYNALLEKYKAKHR